MAEAWGAKPTPMNFNELYLALKQGVVDGQENPLPTIKAGKFGEVQKYIVLTGHIMTPRFIVVNEAFWQKIKPEDRKAVEDAIKAAISWHDAEIIKAEKSLIDEFKAAGVTIIEPDLDSFRKPRHGDGAGEIRSEVGQGHVRPHRQHQVMRRPVRRDSALFRRMVQMGSLT